MASTRAGRDVGGMNDLPIPGQPGSTVPNFDINTMRSIPPAAAAAAAPSPDMTRLQPATPIPMLPSVANPQVLDSMINRIMTPPPAPDSAFKQPKVPPAPVQPQVPDVGIPNSGIPTLKPGSENVQAPQSDPTPTDNTARNSQLIRGRAGIDPSTADPGGAGNDWKSWAVKLGIPLAVAALLFRGKGGAREGGSIIDRLLPGGKALEEGGAAASKDVTPYADNTIANATDEARARVNEASGGQPVTQGTQDKLARQLDINSGKIKPQDYAEGEKPKPGTEGYKAWFKYRQQLSRGSRSAPQ